GYAAVSGSIGVDDRDPAPTGSPAARRVRDAGGGPVREAAVAGKSALPRSVGIHNPELGMTVGFGSVGDEAPVRGPARVELVPGRPGEATKPGPVRVDGPDVVDVVEDDPAREGGEVDRRASRRLGRR